jgi:hypothetical protein
MQTQKKIRQTDAIFGHLAIINPEADRSDHVLRISMDAKAAVKIGCFSRGGKSRLERKAWDHDFRPETILTPFGILLPQFADLSIYFTASSITSDFIVDVLQRWWQKVQPRFPKVDTLVINQDNGPENNSRRTQFLKRMVAFAQQWQINVRLAYYPPYHSKYNPVERCWGVLENYWSGEILDEVETALRFVETMTWKGKHPHVELVSDAYRKGIRLARKEMKPIEAKVQRLPGLEKWFVNIPWYSGAG